MQSIKDKMTQDRAARDFTINFMERSLCMIANLGVDITVHPWDGVVSQLEDIKQTLESFNVKPKLEVIK